MIGYLYEHQQQVEQLTSYQRPKKTNDEIKDGSALSSDGLNKCNTILEVLLTNIKLKPSIKQNMYILIYYSWVSQSRWGNGSKSNPTYILIFTHILIVLTTHRNTYSYS